MLYGNEFRQEMPYDDIDINITNQNVNTNTNTNMNEVMGGGYGMPMMSSPVVETPRERCIYRNILHEVPHVCPINTKVINNHIYRHTYQPRYTCSEENVVTQQQCGSCCQFR